MKDNYYLCFCNNCESIYIDPNPGDDSVAFPEASPEIEQATDIGRDPDEGFPVCPKCETDGHMVDMHPGNPFAWETLMKRTYAQQS